MAQGRCLLYLGRVPEGVRLLDEAMVGVTTGEMSPIFAGQTYCSLIEACQEISDFDRVAQWTTALTTWCSAQVGLVPFTGQCAVHRGQVMRVRGAFVEAIAELDGAIARYVASATPGAAGLAYGEKGGLLRIRGEYDAAEAAFQQAIGFGNDPQPAQALLSLARGRTEAAAAAVRRVLGEPRDPIHRSQLLPGSIEVLLAADDLDAARPLVAELVAVGEAFDSSSLRAMGGYAVGALALVEERPENALAPLRAALQSWRELDWPYEVARTQVLVGRALRGLGDEESAAAELRAAGQALAALGAAPAADEVAAAVGSRSPAGRPHGSRGRGAAAGRHRTVQPRDRRRALPQREDGRAAPQQHLHQAERHLAHRRGGVRLRTRAHLSAPFPAAVRISALVGHPGDRCCAMEDDFRAELRMGTMRPKTGYARNGDIRIAYQVVGDGPIDLVMTPGYVSHLDLWWMLPETTRFMQRLASFSRLILYDKRGTGLSDPAPGLPAMEERMEDLHAVLDAVGSEHTALLGFSEGGPLSMLFAATYPGAHDRARPLRQLRPLPRRGPLPAPDPQGSTRSSRSSPTSTSTGARGGCSTCSHPSYAHDTAMRESLGLYERLAASPSMASALLEAATKIDVTHVLSSITCPTLVLHRDRRGPPDRGGAPPGRAASRARGFWSSRAPAISRGSATPSRCSTPSRSSSPGPRSLTR